MAGITVPIAASADLTDFKRVERQMQSLAHQARKTGSSFDNLGKLAKRAFALGAVVAIGKKMIDEATQAYQVSALTNTILKNTGAAAWTSTKAVSDLSTKLSNLTGIDDELIQAGSNVILSFGNIRNAGTGAAAIFDRATAAATDMGKALGIDTSAAAKALGKALSDPVKGTMALRKAGVLLSNEQQAQIKAMQQRGDLLGAQQVVLAAVEGRYKGAAAAMASPMERLQTMLNNILEAVGTPLLAALTPIMASLQPVLEGLTPVLEVFGNGLAIIITQIVDALIPYLPTFADLFAAIIPIVVDVVKVFAPLLPLILGFVPVLTLAAKALSYILKPALFVVQVALAATTAIITGFLKVLAWGLGWIPGLGDALTKAADAAGKAATQLSQVSLSSTQADISNSLMKQAANYKGAAFDLNAGAAATVAAGQSFAQGARQSRVAVPRTRAASPTTKPTSTASQDQSFTVAGSGGGLSLSVTVNGSVVQERDIARTIRDELLQFARRQGVSLNLGV